MTVSYSAAFQTYTITCDLTQDDSPAGNLVLKISREQIRQAEQEQGKPEHSATIKQRLEFLESKVASLRLDSLSMPRLIDRVRNLEEEVSKLRAMSPANRLGNNA